MFTKKIIYNNTNSIFTFFVFFNTFNIIAYIHTYVN